MQISQLTQIQGGGQNVEHRGGKIMGGGGGYERKTIRGGGGKRLATPRIANRWKNLTVKTFNL